MKRQTNEKLLLNKRIKIKVINKFENLKTGVNFQNKVNLTNQPTQTWAHLPPFCHIMQPSNRPSRQTERRSYREASLSVHTREGWT